MRSLFWKGNKNGSGLSGPEPCFRYTRFHTCLLYTSGTAKGGIAIAIARELGVPVKYAGVGEGIDDLRPFDALEFAQALI